MLITTDVCNSTPQYSCPTWVGGDGLVHSDSREGSPGQRQVGGAIVLLSLQVWCLWHTGLQTDIRGGAVGKSGTKMWYTGIRLLFKDKCASYSRTWIQQLYNWSGDRGHYRGIQAFEIKAFQITLHCCQVQKSPFWNNNNNNNRKNSQHVCIQQSNLLQSIFIEDKPLQK